LIDCIRLDTIPQRDGQTDKRTDGQKWYINIALYKLAHADVR